MKKERSTLTSEWQGLFKLCFSCGERGPGIGTTEREFISYRKGECPSFPQQIGSNAVDYIIRQIGSKRKIEARLGHAIPKMQDDHRRDPHQYYIKTEKSKKLIALFLRYAKENKITTKLGLSNMIRMETGRGYDPATLKNNLDPNGRVITKEFLDYALKKTVGVYGKSKILSYCNAKTLDEITESDRIHVTVEQVNQIKEVIKKRRWSIEEYARNANVDSATVANIIYGRIKTTLKKVMDPCIHDPRSLIQRIGDYMPADNENSKGIDIYDSRKKLDNVLNSLRQEGSMVDDEAKNFSWIEFNLKGNKKMLPFCYDFFIAAKLYCLLEDKSAVKSHVHEKVINALSSEFYQSANKETLLSVYGPLARYYVEKKQTKIKSVVKVIFYLK